MTSLVASPTPVRPPEDLALHVFDLEAFRAERAAFEAEASDAERARAARLSDEGARERCVLRHGVLRRLLSEVVGVPPGRLRLATGYGGKPRLADAGPCFSPSSSGDLFVVAISPTHEVGADVERLLPRADLDDLAAHHLPRSVRAHLAALSPPARVEAFYRAWTLEEAVGKLDGRGLAEGMPMEEVPVAALARDGEWRLPAGAEGRARFVESRALGDAAVVALATTPRAFG